MILTRHRKDSSLVWWLHRCCYGCNKATCVSHHSHPFKPPQSYARSSFSGSSGSDGPAASTVQHPQPLSPCNHPAKATPISHHHSWAQISSHMDTAPLSLSCFFSGWYQAASLRHPWDEKIEERSTHSPYWWITQTPTQEPHSATAQQMGLERGLHVSIRGLPRPLQWFGRWSLQETHKDKKR